MRPPDLLSKRTNSLRITNLPEGPVETSPWKARVFGRQDRTHTFPGGLVLQEHDAFCTDCQEPWPSMFMVHNSLWAQYGSGHGVLCLRCFEKRLGAETHGSGLDSVSD